MSQLQNVALIPLLIASFLGSPHCAGMCGGFVGIYSHQAPGKVLPHLLYSLGRLCTYLLLGVIAAIFGTFFDSSFAIGHLAAFVVGAGLIVWGLSKLFSLQLPFLTSIPVRLGKLIQFFARPVFKVQLRIRPFLIGFVTTFLPCGWLYTFVALALASADVYSAALIMFVFWLGTLPMMLTLGAASRAIVIRLGRFQPKLVALLLMLSGILCINLHLQHVNHHGTHSHATQQD